MSRDGLLPDDVSENDPRAPWNEPSHCDDCPCNEDAPARCQCGHLEDEHSSEKARMCEVNACDDECEGFAPDNDPDCTCPSKAEIAAERAEMRADQERDDR